MRSVHEVPYLREDSRSSHTNETPEPQPLKTTTQTKGRERPKELINDLEPCHIPLVLHGSMRNARQHVWVYGWTMNDELLDLIFDSTYYRYCSYRRKTEKKYKRFADLIREKTQCETIQHVLVEPTSKDPWPSALAKKGERAASFYAITSTCKSFHHRLPAREEMKKLKKLFGGEAGWAMLYDPRMSVWL
ncbi:hypothetical protein HDZ31DRAFT_59767 [Schizophyllum fasciatum]